jgi:hypothetical protein
MGNVVLAGWLAMPVCGTAGRQGRQGRRAIFLSRGHGNGNGCYAMEESMTEWRCGKRSGRVELPEAVWEGEEQPGRGPCSGFLGRIVFLGGSVT